MGQFYQEGNGPPIVLFFKFSKKCQNLKYLFKSSNLSEFFKTFFPGCTTNYLSNLFFVTTKKSLF